MRISISSNLPPARKKQVAVRWQTCSRRKRSTAKQHFSPRKKGKIGRGWEEGVMGDKRGYEAIAVLSEMANR